MDIRKNFYLEQKSGDFGTKVSYDDSGAMFLDVPPDLFRFMEYAAIYPRTAEMFVSYVWTFPGVLRFAMGWTMEEVETARDRLVSQLHGLVEHRYLCSTTELPQTHFLTR